jgi:hypothetical protein
MSQLMPTSYETNRFQGKRTARGHIAAREQAMFGNGFVFSHVEEIYGTEDLIAQAKETQDKTHPGNRTAETKADISVSGWNEKDGNSLAKLLAKKTSNGGLMILGPHDWMRGRSEKFKDPEGRVPVFTHASPKDFHLYYGLGQLRKEYSAETLAELIRKNVPEGKEIRLLGCESGVHGGIAKDLARLLPKNPIYAPDGYCSLDGGSLTVLKKKYADTPGAEPPHGEFVLVKP